jgi:hypothetical protein
MAANWHRIAHSGTVKIVSLDNFLNRGHTKVAESFVFLETVFKLDYFDLNFF